MKTKLCRPILVESKEENPTIIKGSDIDYLVYVEQWSGKGIPQQLILISLDPDEKIEIGDTIFNLNTNTIIENWKGHGSMEYWRKVIATQSQLSPEYIQQFIEEYNKGEVKDVEIEMETEIITESIAFQIIPKEEVESDRSKSVDYLIKPDSIEEAAKQSAKQYWFEQFKCLLHEMYIDLNIAERTNVAFIEFEEWFNKKINN